MDKYGNRLQELIRQAYRTDAFRPTAELLKSLGMTSRRFSAIYNNSQNPTFDELFRLCEIFDFDPRQFPKKEAQSLRIEVHNFKSKLLKKHG